MDTPKGSEPDTSSRKRREPPDQEEDAENDTQVNPIIRARKQGTDDVSESLRKNCSIQCVCCLEKTKHAFVALDCETHTHEICFKCLPNLMKLKPDVTINENDDQDVKITVSSCKLFIKCPQCRQTHELSVYSDHFSGRQLFQETTMLRYANGTNNAIRMLHRVELEAGVSILEEEPKSSFFSCPHCDQTFNEPVPCSHMQECAFKMPCPRCKQQGVVPFKKGGFAEHLEQCPTFECDHISCRSGARITLETLKLHKEMHKLQEQNKQLGFLISGSFCAPSTQTLRSYLACLKRFHQELILLEPAARDLRKSHEETLKKNSERTIANLMRRIIHAEEDDDEELVEED